MAEATHLEKQQRYIFAIDSYRKANKIADNKDARCLDKIFALQIKMGLYKDAAKTAAELESAVKDASSNP